MKIGCYCGETIIDTTDYLPWKAWLTPDQDWFDTFEAMDDQVIRPASRINASGRLSNNDHHATG